ncbi:MAG: ATP-binding cassette domain-containing protein [Clostridiales bacterium]|jgi:Fe-S cluster assembly ATP-binding protein|nr:ATP-binding cassette domain-containing protein [Eubacteriales bacterium]MDH7566049.1 ATP-binding cassette domain-containing protein [Clostridiales bacterium]
MLELRGISYYAETRNETVRILDDINIKFEDRKLYVITGPNGGGKSSLARIIMGINRPTAGRLSLDGEDITDLDITSRARLGIGYAFQNPPRFKGINVKQLLDISVQSEQVGQTDKKACDTCALLNNVGLCASEYLHRDADTSLSGGEMKRIEIASILSRNLKFAVFDEPEAGIDLWSFAKLAETFENMHRTRNTTIVIISHQERILELADEVIVISGGKIEEVTTKQKILAEITHTSDCSCGTDCGKGVGMNA